MANEVILTRSTKKGDVVLPDFNKDTTVGTIADEPRRLKISVRKMKNKTTGNLFNSVSGYVKLEVINAEGKSEGIHVKKLSVHFKLNAFDNAINVKGLQDLKSGYLYCKAKDIQIPSRYEITEEKDDKGNLISDDEGNIKLKYPEIWISGVIGLQEFVTNQDALNVDVETGEVLDAEVKDVDDTDYKQFDSTDENETEEVNL